MALALWGCLRMFSEQENIPAVKRELTAGWVSGFDQQHDKRKEDGYQAQGQACPHRQEAGGL